MNRIPSKNSFVFFTSAGTLDKRQNKKSLLFSHRHYHLVFNGKSGKTIVHPHSGR